MSNRLWRLIKHRWFDAGDARRTLGKDGLARIEAGVVASERQHTGEIRVCIEASLPLSYLWRNATARERALAMFGKLHVWDTEHNNGVLIYLLLAERAIEIVADRGLARQVGVAEWEAVISGMRQHFSGGRFEAGLTAAIAAVDAQLRQHFPLDATQHTRSNELPDAPDLR